MPMGTRTMGSLSMRIDARGVQAAAGTTPLINVIVETTGTPAQIVAQSGQQPFSPPMTLTIPNVPLGPEDVVAEVTLNGSVIASSSPVPVNVQPGINNVSLSLSTTSSATATPRLFEVGAGAGSVSVVDRLDNLPTPTATTSLPLPDPTNDSLGVIEGNQALDAVTVSNFFPQAQLLVFNNASSGTPTEQTVTLARGVQLGRDTIQVNANLWATLNDNGASPTPSMQIQTINAAGNVVNTYTDPSISTGEWIRQDPNLGVTLVLDDQHNVRVYNLNLATAPSGNVTPLAVGTNNNDQPVGIDYDPAHIRLYVLTQNSGNSTQFGVFVIDGATAITGVSSTLDSVPTFTFAVNGATSTNAARVAADVPAGAADADHLIVSTFVNVPPPAPRAAAAVTNGFVVDDLPSPDALTGTATPIEIAPPTGVNVFDATVYNH